MVLLFLTKPLSYLPNAVLAAIVLLIGVKLINLRGLAEIRKKSRNEYAVALAIAAIVLFIGVKQGIMAAIVLSLLDHVRQGYRPHTAIVLTDPLEHWRMEPVVPGKMIEPGLVMYWFGADLYYANANYFAEQALHLVTHSPSPVRWLVVDAGAITDVDYSAGKTLKELQRELRRQGRRIGLDPGQREPKSRLGSPAVDRRDRSPSHFRLPERLLGGLLEYQRPAAAPARRRGHRGSWSTEASEKARRREPAWLGTDVSGVLAPCATHHSRATRPREMVRCANGSFGSGSY